MKTNHKTSSVKNICNNDFVETPVMRQSLFGRFFSRSIERVLEGRDQLWQWFSGQSRVSSGFEMVHASAVHASAVRRAGRRRGRLSWILSGIRAAFARDQRSSAKLRRREVLRISLGRNVEQFEARAMLTGTIFSDDFNTSTGSTYDTDAAIGTSTTWSLSRSGGDWGARIDNGVLDLTNDASAASNANGWVFGHRDIDGVSGWNTTLSSNSGTVTWEFNIRTNRANLAGFGSGNYGLAFILAGTSTNANNTGSGYALVLGNSSTPDPFRLVSYNNGLSGTQSTLVTSNTSGFTDIGTNYYSVGVTYAPSTNTWKLFLRNDGTSAFTSPSTGTLVSQGTAVNNTYTSTSGMRYVGGFWQGSTAANLTAFFDNISLKVEGAAAPTITGAATATAFTTTYGTASAAQTFSVSGSNLTANLVATAPTGFEVSSDGTTYGSTATFNQSDGSAGGTLSVRLAATAAVGGAYDSQNIVLSSTGATDVNIATAASGNSVAQKVLTIAGLTANNKGFDDTTSVSVTGSPTYDGLVNGESFAVTGSVTWAFPDANVGNDKSLTRTGNYNAPSGNYSVTQPTLTANITAVAPGAPTIDTITPSDGQLIVAFTPPSFTGGVAVTDYKYSLDGGTFVSAGSTASPLTISGLTNGQTYAVRLLAVNSAGDGTSSDPVNGTPNAPAVPTVTVSGLSGTLVTTYGTASPEQTFSVSGATLSGNLTVTAPTGIEVSTTSGESFADSLVLTATGGVVSSTTIFVRLKPTANVGDYNNLSINVTGGGDDKTVSTAATGNSVSQKALTIGGIAIADKEYDGGVAATITGTAAYVGLVNGESFGVTGSPTASFADKTAGNGKSVTVVGFTAPSSNYSITQPSGLTANITAKALTISGAAVSSKTYDGTDTATITGTLTGVVSGDTVDLVASGTFATPNAGAGIAVTSTSTLSGADAANYSLTQPTGLSGDVAKATQTITFGTLATAPMGSPLTLTATSSSGLTVTYVSSNTNVATIAGSTVTLVAPGVTVITASQAGDGNFEAATSVSQTLNVAPASASSSYAGTYTFGSDGNVQSFDYNGSAITNLDVSALTKVGVTTSSSSGNSRASDWGTGSTNGDSTPGGSIDLAKYFEFTLTAAAGFTIENPSIDFGVGRSATGPRQFEWRSSLDNFATPINVTANNASLVNASNVLQTPDAGSGYTGNTVALTTSGQSAITFRFYAYGAESTGGTGGLQGNLSFGGTLASSASSGAITPFGSFTAMNTTAGVASAASATTVDVSGGGLTADITATVPTGFEVSSDGSTWGTTTTFAQTDGFASGTLSVRIAAGASVGSLSGDVVLSSVDVDAVNVAIPLSTVELPDGITAGTIATGLSTTYGTASASTSFTVEGRNLSDVVTVTAPSGFEVSLAAGSGFGSSVQLGGVGNLTSTPVYVRLAATTAAGQLTGDIIVASPGYDSLNVAIPTSTVAQKQLTITGATAVSRVYDGSTTVVISGGALDGVVGGDNVTLAGAAVGSIANAGVGIDKSVTVTGLTIAGADAANYRIAQPTGLTATITAKELTVTGATAASRVYDGSTTVVISGGTLVGVVGSDNVTLGGAATGSIATAGVGSDKSVTVTGFAISGADAANYTIAQPTGLTITISAKELTVTGATATSRVYDGTTTVVINGGTLDGVVGSDSVTLGGTPNGSIATAGVGNDKAVTVTGFTISGAEAANYTIAQPTGLTASITAKELTITGATATSRVYDGTTSVVISGGTLDGVVGSDSVTLGGSATGSIATAGVGNDKAVTVTGFTISGAEAANYTLAQPTGLTATITAKELTVTGATATSRVYDGTTSVVISGGTLDGVVGSDSVTLGGTPNGSIATAGVGNDKAVTVTGFTISGAEAANYTIAQPTGLTATITAKELTITGATATSRVYDGTTTVVISGGTLDGIVGSDNVTLGGSATGSIATAGVGSDKSVTVTGFAISGADAANYTIAQPTGLTASITAKELTVTGATAAGRVYDGTTAVTVSGGSISGVVGSDTVTLGGSPTGSLDNKNVGTDKAVTVTGFAISGTDAANYTLAQPTGLTATITALALTGSITANNKIFDGTDVATIATRTLTGAISGDDVSYFGGTATFASSAVGTGITVTATGLSLSGADAGNYTVNSSATTTADINEQTGLPQTITFDDPGPKTYGDADFELVATASSGLPVSFLVVMGPATVNGSTLTITGAGTVTVRALQAGNVNYDPANPVDQTFNVAQKGLGVSISASNKTYDGTTDASVTYSLTGIVGSDDVVASGTAFFVSRNAGTGIVVNATSFLLSGDAAANYAVTNSTAATTADIAPLALTASVTAANKTYDGNDAASVTITLAGVVDGDAVTGSASGTFADKNAGTGKTVTVGAVTLAGADAGNYTVGSAGTTTADIAQLALTASATAANKTYDGNDAASVTITLDGVLGGDVVTATASGTFADKNAGAGKIVTVGTVTLAGVDAANYTVGSAGNTTADITQLALTASATAANKTYDGNDSASVTITLDGVLGGDVVTATASGTFADKNAGAGKIVTVGTVTLAGVDAANYTVGAAGNTTADIAQLALTASATAANKTYDGNDAASVTITLDGVLGGDVVTATASGTFADKNAGAGKVVTVGTVTLAGVDAANYTVGSAGNTTADIAQLALTASATAANKTYDGNDSASVTITLDGVLGGDVVTATASGTFADRNAGAGKVVTVGTVTLAGVDAANYTVGSAGNTTADIAQLALTASATAANKTYDGNDGASVTITLDGIVGGDVVTATASGTFADKNAEAGKVVTVGTVTLAGVDAANYTVGSAGNTTADITQLALAASATAASKTYDGNDSASVTITLDGVLGGDVVTATASGTFADRNAGTGKVVTVGTVTLAGVDAANYTVGSAGNTTADIAQLALTASATAANKTYDGNDSASVTITLDGIVGGDVVTGTSSGTFADKNAGAGKVVTVGNVTLAGVDAANYTVGSAGNTTADITQLALTASATAASKTYDGNDAASVTITLDGIVGGDVVTGTASGTFSDKNAGAGKVVTVGTVTLAGVDAANYTVGSAGNTTADIAQLALTASATAANKTYDGNDSASVTITLDGVLGGDVVTATASGTFADRNAGAGKVVTVGTVTLAGVDAANYTVGSAGNTTADIAQLALTASATAANKTYDGNDGASVTITLDGIVGGDVVTGTASGSFADKNAEVGKTVTVGTVTLAGADAANYTVGSAGTTTADITQRALTASATATDKMFDGNTVAEVTITLVGVLSGESVNGAATGSFDTIDVGTDKTVTIGIVTLSGPDASNYSIGSVPPTTASITPVVGAPEILPQTFLINSRSRNQAVVGSVVATDPDPDQTLTYAITGGNAAGAYAIDPITGTITIADSTKLRPLPESLTPVSSVLTVTVTDDGIVPLSSSAQITITLSSVQSMTPFASSASFTIAENNRKTDGSTRVGTLKPLAAYSGQRFGFSPSLTGPDADSFAINNRGLITLRPGVALDYESKSTYSFVVVVSDARDVSKSTTVSVTVNVKDINEAPVYTLSRRDPVTGTFSNVPITKSSALIALDENIPTNVIKNGLVVAVLTASDVDAGTVLALQTNTRGQSIVLDKTGAFEYNLATGEITIKDETKVDFERFKTIKLNFIVTDTPIAGDPKSKPISTKLTVTIALNDLNEAPVIAAEPSSFSIAENNRAGARVGVIKAKDPDTRAAVKQTISYSIVSQVDSTNQATSIFSIDGKGTILVSSAGALDFETSPYYDVVVRVTDNGTPTLFTEKTIRINVRDMNEAATFGLQNSLDQNAASLSIARSAINNNDKVGRLLITDLDAGLAGSYSTSAIRTAVEAASRGAFTYDELTGDLLVKDKSKLTKTFTLRLALKDQSARPVTSRFSFVVNVTA